MTELLAARNIEEAIASFNLHKVYQPFRFAGYKYLMKVSEDTFMVRERKPKEIKEGQELYKLIRDNSK